MATATKNEAEAKSQPSAKREIAPTILSRRFPLRSLRRELESLFSDLWSDVSERLPFERLAPDLDMSETDDTIRVQMDLPGLKPGDFDIQIHDNVLTISGKREEEKEEKGRTYHVIERATGRFSRSISMPCDVQEDRAEARYRDGVLTVDIPKAAQSKAHRIPVK
jgi:HSP20 family protein